MSAVSYTANKGLNLLGSEVFVGFVNQTSGSETSSITDYSGNSPVNDLTVTGTLTKTAVATSAESMGFSGWSGSNYASSAYDADYDFGTDDFFFQFWLKETSNPASIEYIIDRSYYSGGFSGSCILIYVFTDGTIKFHITDDGDSTHDIIQSATAIDDSLWRMITLVRRSTKMELWINDSKDASDVTITNAAGSLNNGSAGLRIGVRQWATKDSPLTHGSIALMKIGAFSPTSAQIKSTYDAEKILFKSSEIYTQVGQGYSLDITAASLVRTNSSIKNLQRSISGITETLHERYDESWSVQTTALADSDLSSIRRFLDAAMVGKDFTFDPYGSTASPDDPVSCMLPVNSYTESRIPGMSINDALYNIGFDVIVL